MGAPRLRWLGRVAYEPTWRAMQQQVDAGDPQAPDEIWFLEHPPVYTLGMNASPGHLLAPGDIPVVQIDRGGQVTYHGPGQLVVYPLLDLARAKLGVRALVEGIERAIVATAGHFGIEARGSRTGCVSRRTVSTFCANTSRPLSTTVSTSASTPWKSGVRASTAVSGQRALMARMQAAKCAAPPSGRSSRFTEVSTT
jgi:hypothetical protein